MPRGGFALVAVALLLAPLAGCFGSDDGEPAAPAAETNVTNQTVANATLPDDRGESAGLKETNVTEQGAGGMDHKHDEWAGRESVVVFDGRVYVSYLPLFPHGEGSQPTNIGYIKLPNGTLVYEGTSTVTVLITDPQVQLSATHSVSAPHPAPPAFRLGYLTAADNEWRDAGAVAYGSPVEIDVLPRESDMPHSTASLWAFRLSAEQTTGPKTVHATITIHKGHSVVDWPGHPDFYAASDKRVVLDKTVTTRVYGIGESSLLYDQTGSWVTPEKLISWGTSYLAVKVTIKGSENDYGATPDGYYLEYHNATMLREETNFGRTVRDDSPPQDLVEWDFVVPVLDTDMDGPYQPESRWGFRVRATYANGQFCPGCFTYDIEYSIHVTAVHDPTFVPQ